MNSPEPPGTSLSVNPSELDLDVMLKKLSLANTRATWHQMVDRAETEDWSCRDFLAVLVAEEIAHREQTRIQRWVRMAGFPFLKTIDDFDFSLRSNLRRGLIGSYLGPELVSEGRNLILMGKTGRGKTHLAIAISYRAIQNGFTAKFATAAALIEELSAVGRQGKLSQALKTYTSPGVLVIDEVGYLTYGPDAANVLFHVVNDRYIARRPIIFTTNKSPFSEWGDALHDKDLAEAIVDRVLERGRLILLDGPSARTQHLNMPDAQGKIDKAAIISGMMRPEFPESTWSSLMAERDRDARESMMADAIARLELLETKLRKPRTKLRTRDKVVDAADIAVGANARRWVDYEINLEEIPSFHQERRGRPGPDTRYTKDTKKRYHVKWLPSEAKISYDAKTDGMFPLLTNCRNMPLKTVYQKYKFQPRLEKRHEQLKTVYRAAKVLLKKITRIEGLLFLYFDAMLVQSLIEREVRVGMVREGIKSVPIYPEGRPCRAPTTDKILKVFQEVQVHHLLSSGNEVQLFQPQLSPLQLKLIRLMGVNEASYACV